MKNLHFVDKNKVFALLLAMVWVGTALLVNPRGDFPLNDDFSFGRTVFNLTERGVLQFDDWLSMTLLTQVLWGAGFCKLFGFSFTVLRCSTLLLGLIGLFAFYRTIRLVSSGSGLAFIGALTLAFNPLFFSLSYSFMTDVPFISLVSLSVLFFCKYFRDEQLKWWLLATVFAVLALLVRQLGLLLPMAFTFTWLLVKKWNGRQLVIGLGPLVIGLLSYFLFMQWFVATQGLPDTFGTFPKLFKRLTDDNFLEVCLNRVGGLLLYLGLFLLPFNLLILQRPKNRRLLLHTIAWCVAGSWLIWQGMSQFPSGNILYNLGLGPKTLKDGFYFINVKPMLSASVLKIIAVFGLLSGNLLIINLVNKLSTIRHSESPRQAVILFLFLCILIYGGFLLLDVHFFDRYFIPLFLFTTLLLSPDPGFTGSTAGLTSVLVFSSWLMMAGFSAGATHDHLSWNRARWKALDHLTNDLGISPNQIDGGFEFNGWHRPVKETNHGAFESWWWVDEENYLVTFGKLDGFEKIKGFSFQTLIPPARDSVFILQKN